MKTIVIDQELEYELQELYILSKHWTSDLNFVEDEVRILKDILNKYLTSMERSQLKEARNYDKILAQQDAIIRDLKSKITEFLKFVEPFINDTTKEIGINFIERFTFLGDEIKALSEYVKLLKKSLFSFTENVMRTDKALFL